MGLLYIPEITAMECCNNSLCGMCGIGNTMWDVVPNRSISRCCSCWLCFASCLAAKTEFKKRRLHPFTQVSFVLILTTCWKQFRPFSPCVHCPSDIMKARHPKGLRLVSGFIYFPLYTWKSYFF